MTDPKPKLGRNILGLSAVSFFTDVSTEMIYPLLPVFLASVLGANASFIGAIEGVAETTISAGCPSASAKSLCFAGK